MGDAQTSWQDTTLKSTQEARDANKSQSLGILLGSMKELRYSKYNSYPGLWLSESSSWMFSRQWKLTCTPHMMTAPICFSSSQSRSLPHRSDKIPSFLVQAAPSAHSQFKFTTIEHISLDNILPNKWDCQANSPQAQERRFDSCICFSFDCFCVGLLFVFCTGTDFLIWYEDDTVWFHLDSSRRKYILLLSLQLCRGTPSPPGAPGETEEEMPTMEDRSTPHHSNWRSHLKACNFFPILWSK